MIRTKEIHRKSPRLETSKDLDVIVERTGDSRYVLLRWLLRFLLTTKHTAAMHSRMVSSSLFSNCIESCNQCAFECEHCATECLKENNIEMLFRCIALTRECAIVGSVNATLKSIGGEFASLLCDSCSVICNACAEECESDSKELDCCAEACRECAEACYKTDQLQP